MVFDDVKAEKLKDVFRAANTVNYSVVETTVGEGETATTETVLTITSIGKTKDELMAVTKLEADYIQGYYYGKPVKDVEFYRMIKQQERIKR